MPRLPRKLRDLILGRPRRGRWTLARRLLQLAILALFAIQFGFTISIGGPAGNATAVNATNQTAGLVIAYPPGFIIKGSLASSIILDQHIPVIGRIEMLDAFAWLEHAVATHAPMIESLVALAVVFTLYFVLLGRFFCGWVCPMDLIFSLFERKLALPRKTPPGSQPHPPTPIEKVAPIASMLIFLLLSYVYAQPLFTSISPIAATTKLAAILLGILYRIPGATLGLAAAWATMIAAALAINLVGEYILGYKRLWCRYICPVGNLYGLVANRYAPLRVKVVNREKCVYCNLCNMVCPMSIEVTSYIRKGTDVLDHRCFRCGRCVEVCPHHVLSLGFRLPGARGPRATPATRNTPSGSQGNR